MSGISVAVSESIATITLRYKKVNPLSSELIGEICSALDDLAQKSVRVVILRAAAGAKVFSAGHDVNEIPTDGRDPLNYNHPLRLVVRAIETHPAPIIAMIEGSVWGGACEVVMSCDLIVAGSDSTLALTPAKLGVPYDISGTLKMAKVADIHVLKEMLFTANPMPVSRLAALGIVNHVVPREELESFTLELARQIAETSPLVHRILKEQLRVLFNSHPLNPDAYDRIQSLRREVYDSEDYQEGIKAFREKRKPVFQGK